MASGPVAGSPGLLSFLRELDKVSIDTSVESLISLLKRRQISGSRFAAYATAKLYLRFFENSKRAGVDQLIGDVQAIGKRLCKAQPKEVAVGNIVRRVLGLIREVSEEEYEAGGVTDSPQAPSESGTDMSAQLPSTLADDRGIPQQVDGTETPDKTEDSRLLPFRGLSEQPAIHRPAIFTSLTTFGGSTTNIQTSMFNLLSGPDSFASRSSTPPVAHSPARLNSALTAQRLASFERATKDLTPEIVSGLYELLDELEQADDRVADHATTYIHASEVVLTQGTSSTILRFLLKAAHRQKFTVLHVESLSYNPQQSTPYELDPEPSPESFISSLTKAGVSVVSLRITDAYAVMSRVSKVLLPAHAVLANGALVAPAGARTIAMSAQAQSVPVVVLAGVYQLSPVYPFDVDELVEIGPPGSVVNYDEGEIMDKLGTATPGWDYVPPNVVGLYVTNLGGHAPTYLYRIVADHYRTEDINI